MPVWVMSRPGVLGDVQAGCTADYADDVSVLYIGLCLPYFLSRNVMVGGSCVQPFFGPAYLLCCRGPGISPKLGIIVPVGGHEGEFLLQRDAAELLAHLP